MGAVTSTVPWFCRVVSSIFIIALLTVPAAVRAQFTFTTNNGAITITGYTGIGGDVTIPASTNGYAVTAIGASAFLGRTDLTNVAIPGSVTVIGENAFTGCAFTSFTIPDSVTNLGAYAFDSCWSVVSATIGAGLTSLPEYASIDCVRLKTITIPDNVTSIGSNAFLQCYALSRATIGDGVASIGGNAFAQCGLTNVIIGRSVTNIQDLAFSSNTHLRRVYFRGDAPLLGGRVFDRDTMATVYYLPGTRNWTATFGGLPAVLWNPLIQSSTATTKTQPVRFDFAITGTADIPIEIDACTNLASPLWVCLCTCTVINGSINFSDLQCTNYPTRYYRISGP